MGRSPPLVLGVPSVPAGVAYDLLQNPNMASTSQDNRVNYDITPPAAPVIVGSTPESPMNDTTPVVEGIADPNSIVTLYDTDGTTVLGTGQAASPAPGRKPVVITNFVITTIPIRCSLNPVRIMSDMSSLPDPYTMAFGGVETGSMNTFEHATVAGIASW